MFSFEFSYEFLFGSGEVDAVVYFLTGESHPMISTHTFTVLLLLIIFFLANIKKLGHQKSI